MLLCLGDANQQTMSSELKKVYMKSGIQIANENEKLYTMLSQVNASQNSRQMMAMLIMVSNLSLVSWLRSLMHSLLFV